MHHPQSDFSTSFPRRLWTVSWKLVLFVGLFLALYIPFVLPYFKFPDTEYETLASAFGRAQIEFLAMVTVILAALAMTRYVDRKPLSTVGFARQKIVSQFSFGAIVGVAMVLVGIAVLALLGNVQPGLGKGPLDSDLIWTTLALLFNTVNQEALVHGYVQQMVRTNFGSAVAVLISSLLLVLMHWTLFNVESLLLLTNLFAAGVFLGLTFLVSRSLWLPIGIHFGWNYFQGPILGLPLTGVDLWNSDLIYMTGPDLVTGGSLGLEAGVIASLIFVLSAAWYYSKWRTRLAQQPELEHTFP